jgi:hypothetical protein
MRSTTNLTDRFFQVLVEEIRRKKSPRFEGSITVAEIYQSLIPYRTHRDRLGAEIAGDYEDSLLRLLAGEGGYLTLESEPARARIRRELELQNPDTGIYREFAAVGVRVNPDAVSEGQAGLWSRESEEAGEAGEAPTPVTSADSGTPNAGPGTADSQPNVVVEPLPERAPDENAERPGPFCPECGFRLPIGKLVRYCPECGSGVLPVMCDGCGETLEQEWKYCVSCGLPART